jgi:hypothetical protein
MQYTVQHHTARSKLGKMHLKKLKVHGLNIYRHHALNVVFTGFLIEIQSVMLVFSTPLVN